MSSRSGIFKIYKGIGAAQFSIIPPRRGEKGFIEKDGAVLVEVAPCQGKDSRGNINALWDQKIKFAISIADMCNLMDTANPKAGRLYHNFNGTSKVLEFVPGEGSYAGTWKLQVQQGKGDALQRVMVPLSDGEYNMIMRLLIGIAAPKIIGWDE